MRTITQLLNMSPGGISPVIHVSQYDSDFTIIFTLYSLSGSFNIENGTTAQIRGTKASGTGYSADATINISAKTVTVAGNAQMTAVAGQNIFEITLYKNNKELSSKNFILHVERAALDADTITDESVLKELNAIIEGAETATQAAEDANNAADRAEAAAQTFVIDSTPTQGSAHAVSSGGVYESIAELGGKIDAVTEEAGATYEQIEIEFGSHTVSDRGLTFTTNTNGTVRVSGTNTGSIRGLYQPRKPDGTKITFELTAGKTYRLTGCPSGGGEDTYELDIRKAASGGGLFHDYGSGTVFTASVTTDYMFTIAVSAGQTIDATFTPKLEEQIGAGRLCAVDSVAREEISNVLSNEAKYALLKCFRHVSWTDHDENYYSLLESALGVVPEKRLEITFNPNTHVVYTDDALDTLKDYMTVTYYNSPTAEGVAVSADDCTLSGTLTDGSSTITATYNNAVGNFIVNAIDFYNVWTWQYKTDGTGNLTKLSKDSFDMSINGTLRGIFTGGATTFNKVRTFITERGKAPMRKNSSPYDYFTPYMYPIPIPKTAKKAVCTVTPNTYKINAFVFRYLNDQSLTKYDYTQITSQINKTGTATLNFSAQENQFLSMYVNNADTTDITTEPEFSVVFS